MTVDCPICKDSLQKKKYIAAKDLVDAYEKQHGIKAQKDEILKQTIAEHLQQAQDKPKRGRPSKTKTELVADNG